MMMGITSKWNLTYYDLWPKNPVGNLELQSDVDADYTAGNVVSFDDLVNTDVTNTRTM